MDRSFTALIVLLAFLTAGCHRTESTPDVQLRNYFPVPTNQPINEKTILKTLSAQFPIGTRFEVVHPYVVKHFGKDPVSFFSRDKDLNVLRAEAHFFPQENKAERFSLTEAAYEVTYHFDRKHTLRAIRVRIIPIAVVDHSLPASSDAN